ncbi:MAG: DUF3035 domain-containing protein [Alphaproteobacteria bacterium]|jgi:hypothetical protein|nr:DUF3035 domain-containing protein [Alphaproteobacteria bacterium]
MARFEISRFLTIAKQRHLGLAVAAVLALGLSACDTLREQAGLTKKAPDEFTVITKAPLVMPPDFSLRPPRPGARPRQEVTPRARARAALLSAGKESRATAGRAQQAGRNVIAGAAGKVSNVKPSGAELALLRKAGALGTDSSIRQIVNRETTVLAEKDSSFADRLLFWRKKAPFGSTVDAGKEAQRLRQAAAAGDAPNKGETPIIKRRKRGLLEGIF